MEQTLKDLQLKEQASSTHETTFHIKRVNASERIAEVAVNFPIFSRIDNDGDNANSPTIRTTPVFNPDRYYFTPCFVIQSDLDKVQKNLNSYYNFHLNKIHEMEEQKEEIFLAKPSKNHTFCGICRQHYDDYFTHINDQPHKDRLTKGKIEKTISCFVKILQKKDKRIAKTIKPAATPSKRGRPAKKQAKKVERVQNIENIRSEEEGQGVDFQLLAKKEPETISAGIVEPMSWVGQFLV